jgi:hypothetical protein
MRLLLILAATLAAFLVACGGGDEIGPEERAETEALLKAAALRLEDLPSGFILDEERFTTNEETAAEQKDNPYAPTLEDLNRFGRILAYEATYSQEVSLSSLVTGGTLFIQTTAAVYRDSEGASEAFEFVRQQASDPGFADEFQKNFASSSSVEVRSATISPMSFAAVGDDRLAFKIDITAHSADVDLDLNFVGQIVGVRRGRAINSVTVLAVGSPSPVQELEDLARTLDERMQDALE